MSDLATAKKDPEAINYFKTVGAGLPWVDQKVTNKNILVQGITGRIGGRDYFAARYFFGILFKTKCEKASLIQEVFVTNEELNADNSVFMDRGKPASQTVNFLEGFPLTNGEVIDPRGQMLTLFVNSPAPRTLVVQQTLAFAGTYDGKTVPNKTVLAKPMTRASVNKISPSPNTTPVQITVYFILTNTGDWHLESPRLGISERGKIQ